MSGKNSAQPALAAVSPSAAIVTIRRFQRSTNAPAKPLKRQGVGRLVKFLRSCDDDRYDELNYDIPD